MPPGELSLTVFVPGVILPASEKRVGETTCFNFALKLAAGQAELARCPPLHQEPALRVQRRQLETLMVTRWPAP